MNIRSVDNHGRHNNEFICGVVEGFYGKPWSFEQRKDLFKTLKDLKLNAFMYAPKDDTKHRAKWRQLYSDHEASELKSLISEAKSMGIDFYYSLAPGLDMVYSDHQELSLLVKKYEQILSLGCESFAILFDDIEPSINDKDKDVFKNYALAQVSVTNMIFEHLNRPKFLFCPTEYCESRAVPNVTNSIYLNTIGTGLHQGIDIMWSGSRVISRLITEDSIDRLTQVIRRPPVIWENLHANDYDKKRVFLGPYSGRSTKIIPKLRGVLTNPNCEYEANYIAIHTLSQWSRCTRDINQHNCCHSPDLRVDDTDPPHKLIHQPMTSGDDAATTDSETIYDPHLALKRAVEDWLPHFMRRRLLPDGMKLDVALKHQAKDLCSEAFDQITKENNASIESDQVEVHNEESNVEMMPEDSRSSTDTSRSEMDTTTSTDGQSQQVGISQRKDSPPDSERLEANSCESCEMQVIPKKDSTKELREQQEMTIVHVGDGSDAIPWSNQTTNNSMASFEHPPVDLSAAGHTSHLLDRDSLILLVELFYLPFEHGHHGNFLLEQVKWLKENHEMSVAAKIKGLDMREDEKSNLVDESNGRQLDLWEDRIERLGHLCGCINRLVNSLIYHCPNKLLIVDLYPYLADLQDLSSMIMEYIKFLRYRSSSLDRVHGSSGGNKQRDQVFTDEQEPWIHRGGLLGDVQRLLL